MAEYKINYTQSNFTGGIIAAELYGRNDFNKVKTGLKKCTNWTIREAGGLEFRRGTKYLQTVPTAAGTNFKLASLDKTLFMFSQDGIRYIDNNNTWQKLLYPMATVAYQDANLYVAPYTTQWSGIWWTGSKFIALGLSYISTSTDGVTWTPATYDANLLGDWCDIASDGTKLVALEVTGRITTSTDDGITWSPNTPVSELEGGVWRSMVWTGSKFVAIGNDGMKSSSTNGTTWAVEELDSNLGSHQWRGVAYNGIKLVAISFTGYISTSSDGDTWTPAVKNEQLGENLWEDIIWDGTRFVALGGRGHVSVSSDGITWSPAAVNENLIHSLPMIWRGMAWDGTKIVALDVDSWVATFIPIDINTIHFSELNRKLYYYDGVMKLCEVYFDVVGTPQTRITKFEAEPTGATITSEKQGTAPDVYVEVRHEYTFALAKDEEHESVVFAGSTYQDANAELTAKNSSSGKGQQVNLKITLTNDQVAEYAGGKILIYKKYQGYYYYLTAVDIVAGKNSYDGTEAAGANRLQELQDKGQLSVDMSKTPKDRPDYLNSDGSITGVNSIADYNQRLFLTQSGQDVTRIIFSQVGNVESFAYSTQRNSDEAGNLELPISNYDSWCKVVSGLDLILSTSYTINKVSGYGDLQTETVLWDGLSKTVEPVRTRRSLIYTNASNRNIYDLTYNEYGQYDSIDLTLLVKYIFEQKTIKRLAFKDYPVKTVYVLCSDGDLYCLTYIKDQNIYAWYKIEHQGIVKDICIVNTDTEDEVYLIVDYDGSYVIERAYHRTDTVYMDCCIVKQLSDITDNAITGLNIFEGKKVRVFDAGNNLYYGDYDIMNPQTVVEGGRTVEIDDLDFNGYLVENGEIQLPEDIELVGPIFVGLPYYAVAETIPLEFSDQNGNSTIGRKKAVNEAYLRYGDSRGVTYKTMGHEYDCGICERDIADNAQFLERGQVKLHTVSEYKWDSTIKILQRQPYPARIESITLGITFNDKS